MAWLRTDSTRVVHTRGGHSYGFEANVPREVPDEVAEELLAKGFVSESGQQLPEDNLDAALLDIIKRGDPKDFKADNTPKVHLVNRKLKKKLSAEEINLRFMELLTDGNIGAN